MNIFFKQPPEVLDYDIDLSSWMPSGDTISAVSVVSSSPADLVVQTFSSTDTSVKIWLLGGTDGNTYKVTATITTAQGRVKEIDFKIRVKDL